MLEGRHQQGEHQCWKADISKVTRADDVHRCHNKLIIIVLHIIKCHSLQRACISLVSCQVAAATAQSRTSTGRLASPSPPTHTFSHPSLCPLAPGDPPPPPPVAPHVPAPADPPLLGHQITPSQLRQPHAARRHHAGPQRLHAAAAVLRNQEQQQPVYGSRVLRLGLTANR